jgi:hypothetical protein
MHIIQVILSFLCINLLFSPEGARIICWSSAGEANCGNMPKSGMVLLSIVTMCFSFMLSFFPLIVALLKCLTAGCLVSNCLINYTNDKAIPVAKFVASRKFYYFM